jgi:hypothetical protein
VYIIPIWKSRPSFIIFSQLSEEIALVSDMHQWTYAIAHCRIENMLKMKPMFKHHQYDYLQEPLEERQHWQSFI